MPLTAIYLLPASPGQASPLSTILSHITLTYQCTLLPPFTLTHHLHASTSSLLPSSTPWPPAAYSRPFFSVLTLSNQQQHQSSPATFLTTSHPNPIPTTVEPPGPPPTFTPPTSDTVKHLATVEQKARLVYEKEKAAYDKKVQSCIATATEALTYSMTSITIPSSDTGIFVEMLTTKMGPLWAPRGTERIVEGTAIALRDGDWILRAGDLRQENRKAGAVSSTPRGVLFEITWASANGNVGEKPTSEVADDVRDFLERLLEGTGAKLDLARTAAGYTPASTGNDANWALAELYTELLRSRG